MSFLCNYENIYDLFYIIPDFEIKVNIFFNIYNQ